MFRYDPAHKRTLSINSLGLWLYSALFLMLVWSVLCVIWVRPVSVGAAFGCLCEIYAAVITLYLGSLSPLYLKEASEVFTSLEGAKEQELMAVWKEARFQYLTRLGVTEAADVICYKDLVSKILELIKLADAYKRGDSYSLQGLDTVSAMQNPAWGSTLTKLATWVEVLKEIYNEDRRASLQYLEELRLIVHFQLLIVVKAAMLRTVQLKTLMNVLQAKEVELRANGIDITVPQDCSVYIKYAAAMKSIDLLPQDKLAVFKALRDEYTAELLATKTRAKELSKREQQADQQRQDLLQQRLQRRPTKPLAMFPSSQDMPDSPQKYQRILEEFASSHQSFSDSQFPHDESSLGDTAKPVVSAWSRPSPEAVVCAGRFNAGDMKQGQLGDCYFLSALSVLSQEHLKAVLVSGSDRESGAFLVRFRKGGKEEFVVVDDYFPLDMAGEWAFARTVSGKELWPMVIEKAYAKLHGSYSSITAGRVQYALSDLTGGSPEEIKLKNAQTDPTAFWTTLARYHSHGYLLGAGSPENERGDAATSSTGIVQGHAYAVLDVQDVDGERLLQLRNPHGQHGTEWNGDWSDGSAKWTQKFRNVLKSKDEDDGIFWMGLEDFVWEFRSLYICRLFDPTKWTKLPEIEGKWKGESAAGLPSRASPNAKVANNPQYLLTISRPCSVFIQLTQQEAVDMFRGKLPIMFMLFEGTKRVTQLGARLVAGSGNPTDLLSVSAEAVLNAGLSYVLLVATMYEGEKGTGGYRISLTCEDTRARLIELR